MKRLEDLIAEKIEDLIHYVLVKKVKPDITIDKVTELDEEQIKEIKKKYEIEGIILDVDETLRKDMKDIPKVNKDWIEKLKGQLKVIIVSNTVFKWSDKTADTPLNKIDNTNANIKTIIIHFLLSFFIFQTSPWFIVKKKHVW